MMKTKLISIALSMVVMGNVSIPLSNLNAITGNVQRTFTEDSKVYTMLKTSDRNGWVVDGKLKKGKYIIVFNTMSTKSIYDDEIILLKKVR